MIGKKKASLTLGRKVDGAARKANPKRPSSVPIWGYLRDKKKREMGGWAEKKERLKVI